MRVTFDINTTAFNNTCQVAINRVGNYSRKALQEACEEISTNSLMQVPVDTGTLASSQYYEITGSYKIGWEAEIGYGKPDIVNPKSGKPASSYMVDVHEDLDTPHRNGKAKFLEDPIREYYMAKHPRTVAKYINRALSF